MFRDLCFILLGYLAGSVLFARIWGRVVAKKDITRDAPDQNPGTANAFINGGIVCGLLTLVCDLLKGFVPVFLYLRTGSGPALGFVMATPVLGHVFPVFSHFRGGKGIATTFGCLLALLPANTAALLVLVWVLWLRHITRKNTEPDQRWSLLRALSVRARKYPFQRRLSRWNRLALVLICLPAAFWLLVLTRILGISAYDALFWFTFLPLLLSAVVLCWILRKNAALARDIGLLADQVTAIRDGDLVLIRRQCTAENGQIVACLVDGEDATLKRFRCQKGMVILQPENPYYEPKIIPLRDFEQGMARIVGVAVKLVREL